MREATGGIDKSEAARALGALGAAKGGEARAKALSREARSEIARQAALVRWEDTLPKATHEGVLRIGDAAIPCAVLDDERRVLTQSGFMRALGRARQAKGRQYYSGDVNLPAFLTAKNLAPFISDDLRATSSYIEFRPVRGGNRAFGYRAELLPKVCEVFIDAERAGKLNKHQKHIAEKAHLILRAFANIGIIALVDEATGFQYDRAKDDLMKILEAYVSKALLPWTERFPSAFFQEIYRLHGWEFRPGHTQGPRLVGKLIKELVYKQLPRGVLEELQRKNPVVYPGMQRKHKHHQWLTEDIGDPHLRNQVSQVLGIMRASRSKREFFRLFERAFPKGQPIQGVLFEENESESEE
jgi:hypothetical protein